MQNITAGFIGLGLIGGSIARRSKKRAPSTVIMAYMRTAGNAAYCQAGTALWISFWTESENLCGNATLSSVHTGRV